MKNALTKIFIGLVALLVVGCAQSLLPVGDTYTISFVNEGNGTVAAKATGASAGTQISLAATPDAGWKLISLKLNDAELFGPNVTNIFTIAMPASNVTITAKFEKLGGVQFSVTATQPGLPQGTISVSPTVASTGDLITVTLAPELNYQVVANSVKANLGSVAVSGSGNSYTFVMPAANVNVTGAFELGSNPSDPITIQAEAYTSMFGIQKETCGEGTENIGWTDAGDWTAYTVTIPETAAYNVEYRVASELSSGAFNLTASGNAFPAMAVAATGGWQSWKTISQVITLNAGQQELKLNFTGGGANVNWFKITKAGPLVAVTFDSLGGAPVTALMVSQGGPAGALPTTTKAGVSFVGWYTNLALTTPFTADTVVNGAITVYAKWSTIVAWTGWNGATGGENICGRNASGTVTWKNLMTGSPVLPYGELGTLSVNPELYLFNNVWGMDSHFGPNGSGTCVSFKETVKGAEAFGWSWNIGGGNVVIYPSVVRGWSPNYGKFWNNTPVLIPQIKNITTLTVSFDIKSQTSDKGNTAFDIWIYPMMKPCEGMTAPYAAGTDRAGARGFELMIWLDQRGQGPWAESSQGTTNLAGRTWSRNLHVGADSGRGAWNVMSYIVQGGAVSRESAFDIKAFILDACAQYGISQDFYVNSIEFGAESCTGNAMIEVGNYNINLVAK